MRKEVCKRVVAMAVGAGAVMSSAFAAAPWFDMSFDQYVPGEALSNKGATGGGWDEVPAGLVATNVLVGSERAVLFSSDDSVGNELVFRADVSAQKSAWTVDVRLFFDSLVPFEGEERNEPVCFTLTDDGADGCAFAGIVNGVWHRLGHAAVTPQLDAWYGLHLESAEMGDATFVSFAIVEGATTNRLATAEGAYWFPTGERKMEDAKTVAFRGRGGFGAFTGLRETSEPADVLYWIGGDVGDWSNSNNWSRTAGGAPVPCVPAPGDLARIEGTVQLTLNGATGRVHDVLARVGADGSVVFEGGAVLADAATLDASRPRAGKALEVAAEPFNGILPTLSTRWFRSGGVNRQSWTLVGSGNSFTPSAGDYERWLRCVVTDAEGVELLAKEFFFSKLPVFYMTTDDGKTPTANKEKHAGKVFVQGNAAWKSQYGKAVEEGGVMEISVRGNSTKGYDKKPWKLKLDAKTEMFGIPKSKHWVLLANYLDESNLRNKLAYDFANEIGSLGMRSTWVECILNGEWQGLYLFCEHVRVDKERVDVFDWEGAGEDAADAIADANGFAKADKKELEAKMAEDFGWVSSGTVTYKDKTYDVAAAWGDYEAAKSDLTGGYLFEFDWSWDELSKFFVEAGNLRLFTMLKSPEYLYTNGDMLNWCKSFMTDYASAITSVDGYSGKGLHYSQYCDIESMASYFLVMEMFGNDDARYKSMYAYKDRKSKKGKERLMKYGPVWDFDWGVGDQQVNYCPEAWIVNHGRNSMYREWADDPWFCTLLRTRYPAARAKFEEIIRDGGLIDQYYEQLKEPALADEAKWKTSRANKRVNYGYNGGIYGTGSHPGLKAYLKTRMVWMDRQFKDVPTLMESLKAGTSTGGWTTYTGGRITIDGKSVTVGDDGNPPQTHPYDRATATLPVAFANAPQGGLWEGQDLRLAFAVGGGGVAKVGVYANGLKVGEPVAPVGGRLDVTIPSAMLTAAKGDPNCVSLVAFDSSSKAMARNYALVTLTEWDDEKDATVPTTDASGASVPSVPFRWIRDAAAGKVPSLATATEEGEFAKVVTATPSPWGKATPLWQDYVAGTDPDPAGSNATFRVTKFELVDGVPRITYAPDLKEKRTYTTFGKERLDDPKEDWQSPAPAGARFFRVEVSLPTGL